MLKRILGLLLLSFSLFSCKGTENNHQELKFTVLTTTTIIQDVVSNIAGKFLKVSVLLPPGSNPHAFQPTPSDIAKLSNAELIFINGGGLETFIDKLLHNVSQNTQVISLSDSLKLRIFEDKSNEKHDHSHEKVDPHVWIDPNNIVQWARSIATVLSDKYPEQRKLFEENSQLYQKELKQLDTWIKQMVSKIPIAKRKIITDHLVFGYFCDRYGFKQSGAIIPAFSTLAEPSARDIARLEDTIKKEGINSIFIDINSRGQLAERIAHDTGIKVVRLYSGSLGQKGSEADTYLKYMRYNVKQLTSALNQ
jgi:ABC-type Zn uptake system ZnuABC Zn-binding protein ZnuA